MHGGGHDVAPHAGAWIEMAFYLFGVVIYIRSRTPRGCVD